MKKLGLFLLAGVLAAVLLSGCGEEASTDPEKETVVSSETAAETSTEIEYNTADNDTSEEVIDLETGANLRETPETYSEEEGIIPGENETPYIEEEDLGIIPDDEAPVDEGGEPDSAATNP